jgi:hypothetical protein
MKTKMWVDRLDLNDETAQMITLFIDDAELGPANVQVRPWVGSIEIRCDGGEVVIPDHAVGPLISALRQVLKSRSPRTGTKK